jgi:serine/threonine protein kinase
VGSSWAAVRHLDDEQFVLRLIPVHDVSEARAQALQTMAVLDEIDNEHLVRQHGAMALAEDALALILDQAPGGSLAQLVAGRQHLTPGETVTAVAPLFGALADLHAIGAVHGDLAPSSILFSEDGRPLISDFGVARLLGRSAVGPADPAARFMAPEVVNGAAPSAASDVHSLAALGWFCLSGAPPGAALTRPPLDTLSPGVPMRLVEVLTACLSIDPSARPSARAAAIEVFESAAAEPVVLTSQSDPATEITRRIRATAAPAPVPAPPSTRSRLHRPVLIAGLTLLVAGAVGGGATWALSQPPVADRAGANRSSAEPRTTPPRTTPPKATPARLVTPSPSRATAPARLVDLMTDPGSPRIAASGVLQALVDARALAYAARNPVLLDLVYAPGATKAGVDRSNLETALHHAATYLGLAFVVKDAVFLDGSSTRARIRATIVTPAYETGQPDGRKIPHRQETVGPGVFTLSLTRDGWRILALTAP